MTALSVMIALLLVAVIMVLLLARRQKLNEALKDAEYRRKLIDLSLSSLKAQMNPHFLFNCLNSIRLYIEQNDNDLASEYLLKFSQMTRSMLENAREERTTLADEIKVLGLYLEMEQMRFRDKLHYEIAIDGEVDAEWVQIPPMLIQPYLENAIWHGIMNKPAGGTVKLHVRQGRDPENELMIVVEDDGIGRERAGQLRNNREHKSLGTQITDDRLSLFNERFRSNASVQITDLFDDNHQPCGTRVTLNIASV